MRSGSIFGNKTDVLLVQQPKQWLPKGSRLLAVEHVPSHSKGGLSIEETGGPGRVHGCNAECSDGQFSDGQFSISCKKLTNNGTNAENSSFECDAGHVEQDAGKSECNAAFSDNNFRRVLTILATMLQPLSQANFCRP